MRDSSFLGGDIHATRQLTWILFLALFLLVAGGIAAGVILLVVAVAIPYATWSAIAGSTIWCKFFADFIISRHAHRNMPKEAPR